MDTIRQNPTQLIKRMWRAGFVPAPEPRYMIRSMRLENLGVSVETREGSPDLLGTQSLVVTTPRAFHSLLNVEGGAVLLGPLFTAQSAEPWHAQGYSLVLQMDEPTIPAWQVVQMASGSNQSGWMELKRYLHNAKQSGRPPSPVAEADARGRYN